MAANANQTHEDLSVFYVRDMRKVGGMLKHEGSDATLSAWFSGKVDPDWMTADPARSRQRLGQGNPGR